jgi:hypothetical protein
MADPDHPDKKQHQRPTRKLPLSLHDSVSRGKSRKHNEACKRRVSSPTDQPDQKRPTSQHRDDKRCERQHGTRALIDENRASNGPGGKQKQSPCKLMRASATDQAIHNMSSIELPDGNQVDGCDQDPHLPGENCRSHNNVSARPYRAVNHFDQPGEQQWVSIDRPARRVGLDTRVFDSPDGQREGNEQPGDWSADRNVKHRLSIGDSDGLLNHGAHRANGTDRKRDEVRQARGHVPAPSLDVVAQFMRHQDRHDATGIRQPVEESRPEDSGVLHGGELVNEELVRKDISAVESHQQRAQAREHE